MNLPEPSITGERSSLPARLAVGHALGLIVFLAWRFGGMEDFARLAAGCALTAAPVITALAWREADTALRRRFIRLLIPLAGIALLVALSTLNPNMRLLFWEGRPEGLIERTDTVPFLPSTVWPADTVRDFLLNAGLVLAGLNLFLARPPRRLQRGLLWALVLNATILAGAGSLFELGRATEILGTIPSPNRNFFATFIYYNHWGAFALLGAGAAAGLASYYWQRAPRGEWQRSPAPLLGLLTVMLLISLPLSGARASTAAGLIFALFLAFRALIRQRRNSVGWSRTLVLAATFLLAVFAAGWLARDNLKFFFEKTSSQIKDLRAGGVGDGRQILYQDTWRLFTQRPVFGWGWNSYRYAFHRVQSSDLRMENEQRTRTTVLDAHNDWLQLLAELGLAGAILAGATVVGIARLAPRHQWSRSPATEIVAAMGCVGLLALVDFPFACPAVVLTGWTLAMTAAAMVYGRERQSQSA